MSDEKPNPACGIVEPPLTPTPRRVSPPMRRGPRLVGDPTANIPQAVRDMLRAKSPPPGSKTFGATSSVGTGGTWGTDGAGIDDAYGTILSASIKRASEKEKYPDNNGETIGYLYYDYRYEGQFEALIPGTLEPGDEVDIGGVTLYVNDSEKQWESKGWSKYRVSAEKHDGVSAAPPGP